MKRAVLIVVLMCAGVYATDKYGSELLTRPMSLNEFKAETYTKMNAVVDSVDSILSRTTGTIADSLDKNFITADTISVGDSLYVTDDIETGDDVLVGDDFTVSDDATITGTLTITDSLYVADDAEINDDLLVKDITVETTANFTGATLTLDNDEISGDKVQGGTIGSTTITTLTVGDSLYVTDDTEIHDDALITGTLTVTDSIFAADDATVASVLTVNDSARITDKLSVGHTRGSNEYEFVVDITDRVSGVFPNGGPFKTYIYNTEVDRESDEDMTGDSRDVMYKGVYRNYKLSQRLRHPPEVADI